MISIVQGQTVDGPSLGIDVSCLEDGPQREAVRNSHPLTTDSFDIITPSVRHVYNIVHSVIVNRLPGINFAGAPRIGKTSMQEIIRKMLAIQHPDIPVGQLYALRHDRSCEPYFWADVGRDLHLAPTSSRQPGAALNKILNAIVTQCSLTNSTIYVVFTDEAQEFGEDEWGHLKDLGNLLRGRGIRLIHIGFAQQEGLHEVKERLKAARRADLIGRFLTHLYPIYGIETRVDLESALAQLDDPKFDYPTQSGICCAQFFMPNAFAGGWRMRNEAANMWAAFDIVSRQVAQRPAFNVGMKSVKLGLSAFFDIGRLQDDLRFRGTQSDWHHVVESVGYKKDLEC